MVMQKLYLRLKTRVDLKTWFLVALIFPIFPPDEGAVQVLLGTFLGKLVTLGFKAWNGAAIAAVILMILKRNKMGAKGLLAVTFCAILALSTFLHESPSIVYIVRVMGSTVILFLLSEIYSGIAFRHYLKAMYYVMTIISVLSAITIYVYYPGMGSDNKYLYALDNVSVIYALHGFAVGFVYDLTAHKKLTLPFLLIYAVIGFAYIYARTATGSIAVVLCAMFVFIYRLGPVKKVSYAVTIFGCVAIFLVVVVVQQFDAVEQLFIALDKDATLNGRTRIWEVGWQLISDHLPLGIGLTDSLVDPYLRSYGFGWRLKIGHLHNIVLEILLKGGIVGFSLFCAMWLANFKSMMKHKKNIITTSICVMILISWLVCTLEYRITIYSMWFLVILTYHINDIIAINNSEHTEYIVNLRSNQNGTDS